VDTNTVAITGEEMMEWQKSLHLGGAQRANQIRELLQESGFDQLQPCPSLLVNRLKDNSRPAAALANPQRDRALILVPEETSVAIPARALRRGLEATWFSLASGTLQPAEGRQNAASLEFPAPGPGEWLLRLVPPTN
jgi:hypothetical protein